MAEPSGTRVRPGRAARRPAAADPARQANLFPEGLPEDEARRARAMLVFERGAQAEGFSVIAGVDEAGRGPLAGPIVAAAVVLGGPQAGLNDSKQLSATLRAMLFDALYGGPHDIGVCVIEAKEIDARGIQWANFAAMAGALRALKRPPDYALVDGFAIPGCPTPHLAIVKGDARSMSIAAASIVAKVTRDRIMEELDDAHPGYGFAKHKGYGTRAHLDALMRLGPCPAHRMSFAPIATAAETAALFSHEDDV